MSELRPYYSRFYDVLLADIDALLMTDLETRNHKQIKQLLDLATECEAQMGESTIEAEWELLSADARRQILEIIEKDRR